MNDEKRRFSDFAEILHIDSTPKVIYSPKESSLKNSSGGSHILSRFSRYLFLNFQTPLRPVGFIVVGGWVDGWVGRWVGGWGVFPRGVALSLIRAFIHLE